MSSVGGSDGDEREDGKRDEEFHRRARDRLSGALSSAFDRAESADLLDGLPDLTAGLDSPLKRIINSSSPWNSPMKSPRATRNRRRKKEPQAESVFHHTFVLKLFDRSVDLAQFEEDAALYPVCRAWMKDQPHNKNFAPRIRTPTPEPTPEEETEDGGEADEVVENGEGLADKEATDEPLEKKAKKRDLFKLPAFEPLSADGSSVRIPAGVKKPGPQDFSVSEMQSDEMTVPKMMLSHMEHWQRIRKSWRVAYANNESRYKESMEVLRDMFEK